MMQRYCGLLTSLCSEVMPHKVIGRIKSLDSTMNCALGNPIMILQHRVCYSECILMGTNDFVIERARERKEWKSHSKTAHSTTTIETAKILRLSVTDEQMHLAFAWFVYIFPCQTHTNRMHYKCFYGIFHISSPNNTCIEILFSIRFALARISICVSFNHGLGMWLFDE